MSTFRRPIDNAESLRSTRRSLGDGTVTGRSRLAMPPANRARGTGFQRLTQLPAETAGPGLGETVTYLTDGLTIGPTPVRIPLSAVDEPTLDGREIDDVPATATTHRFATFGYKTVTVAIIDCPVGADGLDVRVYVDGEQRSRAYTTGNTDRLDRETFRVGRVVPGEDVWVEVSSGGSHTVGDIEVTFEHVDRGFGGVSRIDLPDLSFIEGNGAQVVQVAHPSTRVVTANAPAGTQAGDVLVYVVHGFAVRVAGLGYASSNWELTTPSGVTVADEYESDDDVNTIVTLVAWKIAGADGSNPEDFAVTTFTDPGNVVSGIDVQVLRFAPGVFPLVPSNPVGSFASTQDEIISGATVKRHTVSAGEGAGQFGLHLGTMVWLSGSTLNDDIVWSGAGLFQQRMGSSATGNALHKQRWALGLGFLDVDYGHTQQTSRIQTVTLPLNVLT